MLTGSVPFPADGLVAKLNARVQADPPAPSELRPELPRGFDAVLGRALARDPARRPATAAELAADARRALRTAPRQRPPRVGRRRTAMLAASGLAIVALAVAAVIVLGGGSHHDPAPTRGSAAAFPSAASLAPCGDLLSAPPGDCRGSSGNVDVLATEGKTARMRTMDFEVTEVLESRAIVDPGSKDTVTAPPGRRFVVIESVVANRLPAAQVFEPDQFAGRQTALYLYDVGGDRLPPAGPDLTDYSAQNLPAAGLAPLSLAGTRLPAPHTIDLPLSGPLVFSYPVAELRQAHTMVLLVREFGTADQSSVGVIRLTAAKARVRDSYEGDGV